MALFVSMPYTERRITVNLTGNAVNSEKVWPNPNGQFKKQKQKQHHAQLFIHGSLFSPSAFLLCLIVARRADV